MIFIVATQGYCPKYSFHETFPEAMKEVGLTPMGDTSHIIQWDGTSIIVHTLNAAERYEWARDFHKVELVRISPDVRIERVRNILLSLCEDFSPAGSCPVFDENDRRNILEYLVQETKFWITKRGTVMRMDSLPAAPCDRVTLLVEFENKQMVVYKAF